MLFLVSLSYFPSTSFHPCKLETIFKGKMNFLCYTHQLDFVTLMCNRKIKEESVNERDLLSGLQCKGNDVT